MQVHEIETFGDSLESVFFFFNQLAFQRRENYTEEERRESFGRDEKQPSRSTLPAAAPGGLVDTRGRLAVQQHASADGRRSTSASQRAELQQQRQQQQRRKEKRASSANHRLQKLTRHHVLQFCGGDSERGRLERLPS